MNLFFTAASPAPSFPIPTIHTIPRSRLPIPKGGVNDGLILDGVS